MIKVKMQYFGHQMWTADSLEKTLMLGKIEGRRIGCQRIRRLNGITKCNGHELQQTPGDGKGQEGLVCCSLWGCKELNTTEWLNNNKKADKIIHDTPGRLAQGPQWVFQAFLSPIPLPFSLPAPRAFLPFYPSPPSASPSGPSSCVHLPAYFNLLTTKDHLHLKLQTSPSNLQWDKHFVWQLCTFSRYGLTYDYA